jgi:hypothetical protein
MAGDDKDVSVAAPAHVHHFDNVARLLGRDLHHMGQGVGRVLRRDDAFLMAGHLERLDVGDGHNFEATLVV